MARQRLSEKWEGATEVQLSTVLDLSLSDTNVYRFGRLLITSVRLHDVGLVGAKEPVPPLAETPSDTEASSLASELAGMGLPTTFGKKGPGAHAPSRRDGRKAATGVYASNSRFAHKGGRQHRPVQGAENGAPGTTAGDTTASSGPASDTPWLQGFDDRWGCCYYYNTETQESVWEAPSDGYVPWQEQPFTQEAAGAEADDTAAAEAAAAEPADTISEAGQPAPVPYTASGGETAHQQARETVEVTAGTSTAPADRGAGCDGTAVQDAASLPGGAATRGATLRPPPRMLTEEDLLRTMGLWQEPSTTTTADAATQQGTAAEAAASLAGGTGGRTPATATEKSDGEGARGTFLKGLLMRQAPSQQQQQPQQPPEQQQRALPPTAMSEEQLLAKLAAATLTPVRVSGPMPPPPPAPLPPAPSPPPPVPVPLPQPAGPQPDALPEAHSVRVIESTQEPASASVGTSKTRAAPPPARMLTEEDILRSMGLLPAAEGPQGPAAAAESAGETCQPADPAGSATGPSAGAPVSANAPAVLPSRASAPPPGFGVPPAKRDATTPLPQPASHQQGRHGEGGHGNSPAASANGLSAPSSAAQVHHNGAHPHPTANGSGQGSSLHLSAPSPPPGFHPPPNHPPQHPAVPAHGPGQHPHPHHGVGPHAPLGEPLPTGQHGPMHLGDPACPPPPGFGPPVPSGPHPDMWPAGGPMPPIMPPPCGGPFGPPPPFPPGPPMHMTSGPPGFGPGPGHGGPIGHMCPPCPHDMPPPYFPYGALPPYGPPPYGYPPYGPFPPHPQPPFPYPAAPGPGYPHPAGPPMPPHGLGGDYSSVQPHHHHHHYHPEHPHGHPHGHHPHHGHLHQGQHQHPDAAVVGRPAATEGDTAPAPAADPTPVRDLSSMPAGPAPAPGTTASAAAASSAGISEAPPQVNAGPDPQRRTVTWTLEELERQFEIMAASAVAVQASDGQEAVEGQAAPAEVGDVGLPCAVVAAEEAGGRRKQAGKAGGHGRASPQQQQQQQQERRQKHGKGGEGGRRRQSARAGGNKLAEAVVAVMGEAEARDDGEDDAAFYDSFVAGARAAGLAQGQGQEQHRPVSAAKPAVGSDDGTRRVTLGPAAAAYVRTLLPRSAAKYWMQRYSLFSRFDSAVQLDTEGWWSVTPEVLATHQALRCRELCARPLVALDACCGCGGNVIQMAGVFPMVIGVEISERRVEMARHNAAVYDVTHKCQFLCADFFRVAPDLKVDVLFMSPPWGGPKYQNVHTFDVFYPLVGFNTSLLRLLDVTLDCVRGQDGLVAAFLPRNTDLAQLAAVVPEHAVWEVERAYVNNKLKGITVYCHPG